jgi:hypothetical protein
MKIKKLKPTDRDYLLRDDKKVLVNKSGSIVIGRGVDSLTKHLKHSRGEYAQDALDRDIGGYADDYYGEDD